MNFMYFQVIEVLGTSAVRILKQDFLKNLKSHTQITQQLCVTPFIKIKDLLPTSD